MTTTTFEPFHSTVWTGEEPDVERTLRIPSDRVIAKAPRKPRPAHRTPERPASPQLSATISKPVAATADSDLDWTTTWWAPMIVAILSLVGVAVCVAANYVLPFFMFAVLAMVLGSLSITNAMTFKQRRR